MRWEQQGGLSSHWTIAFLDQSFIVLLLLGFLVHSILGSFLPPVEDELYYWAWTQHLRMSYYDHPPMVAYFIKLSTTVFGNTLFGIRFPAFLSSFTILFTLSRLSEKKNLLLLLLLSPLFFFGGILITPDTPFLLFWTLYAYWLTTINRVFSEWSDDPVARVYRSTPIPYFRWTIGGCLLGLGILSKYSMFLAIPCTVLVLFSRYRMNAWLKGFIYHLVLASVIASPIFFFNKEHGFEPLKYQWAHTMASSSWGHFWGFIGSQALLVSALPFLMIPWVLLQLKELNSNFRMHVCLIFYGVPLTFILIQAMRSHLEANWGLMAYITFWPIAQTLLSKTSFRPQARFLVFVSFLPALVASGLLLVHSFTPLSFVPIEKDRVTRARSQFALSKSVVQDLRENGKADTLFAPTYQWVAAFRFEGYESQQVFPGTKPSSFTLEPVDVCARKSIIYFSEKKDIPQILECFNERTVLREYPLMVRGKEVDRYVLVEYGHKDLSPSETPN